MTTKENRVIVRYRIRKADIIIRERKEIMKTAIFAFYLNSESYIEALQDENKQSLYFMRSYKVSRWRRCCVI